MAGTNWVRRAPLIAALAFAVLVIVGAVLSLAGSPNNDEPGAQIAQYYNEHEGRVAVGAWVFTLSTVPLLFFVTSVRAAIRREEGDRHLATAALSGGLVAIAMLIASNAATLAAVFRVSCDKGVLAPQSARDAVGPRQRLLRAAIRWPRGRCWPALHRLRPSDAPACRRAASRWYGRSSRLGGVPAVRPGSRWEVLTPRPRRRAVRAPQTAAPTPGGGAAG